MSFLAGIHNTKDQITKTKCYRNNIEHWVFVICHLSFRSKRGGFTMIELLVVVSIIGILTGVGTYSFNNAQGKARDARRKQDAAQIKAALALYYEENKTYPPTALGTCTVLNGSTTYTICPSDLGGDNWIPGLSGYIPKLPRDPKQTGLLTSLASLFNFGNKSASLQQGEVAAASVGPRSPTTFAQVGTQAYSWTNPANAANHDTSYATVNLPSSQAVKSIKATGFGFTSAMIPANAINITVKAEVEYKSSLSGQSARFFSQIVKAGTATGTSISNNVTAPTVDTYVQVGNVGNWGTTLTPADITNSGFGIQVNITNLSSSSVTFSFNHIRLTVNYDLPPTVSGQTNSNITATSATLGANITSAGSTSIIARGTCWNTTNTVANCLAEGGTAIGVFTHNRTGLPSNSTIYYWGYATNSWGTSYTPSTINSFATPPACTSTAPTAPTLTSPTNGALNVDSSGPALQWSAPTSWGTECNTLGTRQYNIYLQQGTNPPTTLLGNTSDPTVTINTGTLTPNVTYYWRVRAVNKDGTAGAYSSVFNFQTVQAPTCSANPNPALVNDAITVTIYSGTGPYSWSTSADGFPDTGTTASAFTLTYSASGTKTVNITDTTTGLTGSCNIQVNDIPTATITANPSSIIVGGSSTLTWSSTNASACTASGGWSDIIGTNGTKTVSPTTTTTYTLTCDTAISNATVTIGQPSLPDNSCKDKASIYCFVATQGAGGVITGYTIWLQLENKNDPEIYTKSGAKCTDTSPDASLYNYCIKPD